MSDVKFKFFSVDRLTNGIELNEDESCAVIRQVLELDAERAGIVFISQHLDDIEMFESARFPVEQGRNRIELREMKVIHPRFVESDGSPARYKLGIGIFAAGDDPEMHHEFRSIPRCGAAASPSETLS